MAALTHAVPRDAVTDAITKLIDNLVNIRDETGEFLLRLPDGRVVDTKGWNDWEWTHGIGLFGLFRYWEQTGDADAHRIMRQWFADRFAAGTPTKNINTVAPFLTLAHLYGIDGNPVYRPYLEAWAAWLMAEDGLPRTEEGGFQHVTYNLASPKQLWDDTLMMSVLPLARIGQLLGRPDYIEEAKRQFLVHIKYLFDPKTGLWFHGWTFDGRHHFGEALWARGNCWVTIALPELLDMLDLPTGDAFRTFLIDTLAAQVRALERHQDDSGLWHTLIVDPTSYLEASATAGFAYGILKAVRKGYLPRRYERMGIRAVEAVLANIDDTGELKQVSFGTPVGDTMQFYKDIPLTSMPYGQSLAIVALAEFLRTYI